jgi:hypothetical protein
MESEKTYWLMTFGKLSSKIGQTTTEDNDVRIKDVDHSR